MQYETHCHIMNKIRLMPVSKVDMNYQIDAHVDPDASTSSPKKGQGSNQPGENLRASEITSTDTERTKNEDRYKQRTNT